MKWTQAQAAAALYYHLEAYKRLECATRVIVPRIARLCVLTEREHVRALSSASGLPGARQVFATPHRVLGRLEALALEGKLTDRDGRPRLRYASLCSGLEGATAAFERLGSGALPVAFSEVDAAANAVLRHRWPEVPRVGDLTAFDWAGLRGQIDLVIGGPPCQPFSVAGRRLGLQDPRGNLILHFLRVVSDLKPRWFALENVPGLLGARDGADFEALLRAVEDSGYACAWRVLDARHFGLPQRRRRLWVVGERGRSAGGPAQVLALDEGEGGDPAPGGTSWDRAPGRVEGGPGDVSDDEEVDWSLADSWLKGRAPGARSSGRDEAAEPMEAPQSVISYAADMRHGRISAEAPTIQVGPATGWSVNATPCLVQGHGDGWLARRFTPLECARLQGLDDDWLDGVKVAGQPLTDSDRYRLLGNSWPVPMAAWVLERLLAVHRRLACR